MSEPQPDDELLDEFADRFMGELGEGVTITPPLDQPPSATDSATRDRQLNLAGVPTRASGTPSGDQFERYWTADPEGLRRWRFHTHPWDTLRDLLREHPGIRDPEGLASTYFRKVFGYWPGERAGENKTGPG